MSKSLIEVKNVVFDYKTEDGNFRAVDDVSFDIKEGEFVAIIGHNGSGKSTLSKNLNAILIPSSGDVVVNGMNTKDENHIWDIRQSAGMVFQNPDNQIVATLVEEDVAFGAENLGIEPAEIRRRVKEALENVGIYELRDRQPHMLSGGQKQRVAIAGIIAMQPRCIIFDEATAMLDPSGRKEVMKTIKRLNKELNITALHITHFMEETIDADRVIVMEKGKIVLEGTPQEVFRHIDKLREIGLDVPYMSELKYELRKEGIMVSEDVLSVDEMVGELCRLK